MVYSLPELRSPMRLAVLISGGGTTLLNFLRQIEAGQLAAEIPLVIASNSNCRGVERAKQAGLRCEVVTKKSCGSTTAFSERIFELCREADVDLVTLAGFLSLIQVPADFQHRVVNIHPSFIPAFCGAGFYGHHVHEAVLSRGAKVSGCTVHLVDNEYDHGPILVQRAVPVLDSDDADSLAARVFEAECEAYPEALRQLASGKLVVDGDRVRHR